MHFCDWATIAVVLALCFRWQWSYELAYFWSLGGTLQALLTPDIVTDFPTIWFLVFFIGHGAVIVSVIFLREAAARVAPGLSRPVADLYRWTRDCRGIRVFRSLLAVLNCGQSSQARLTMALPSAHSDVGHQFSRQDLTSPHSSTRGPFRP
jgi:Integral membrane protein (intg_mem_TP0381)